VQRGLDELQQMRDAIDAGRAIGAPAALIAQLEGFDAARAAAAPAQALSRRAPTAPASPPPAPAAAVRPAEARPPRAEPLPPVERSDPDLERLDEIALTARSRLERREEPTIGAARDRRRARERRSDGRRGRAGDLDYSAAGSGGFRTATATAARRRGRLAFRRGPRGAPRRRASTRACSTCC
jgi:hypothetical protein